MGDQCFWQTLDDKSKVFVIIRFNEASRLNGVYKICETITISTQYFLTTF